MSARAFLAALRLPRPAGAVVTLAGRPGSPVAHMYVGPRTPSGFVPRRSRPVCGARTRRLSILENASNVLELGGRRVCARCTTRLAGPDGLVTRDDFAAAYAGTTVLDLVNANELVTSTDESHRLGYLAGLLFAPPPPRLRDDAGREQVELFHLHRRITTTRDRLRALERTPEQVEANRMRREADLHNFRLREQARRVEARQTRTATREQRGEYVAPWERDQTGASQ